MSESHRTVVVSMIDHATHCCTCGRRKSEFKFKLLIKSKFELKIDLTVCNKHWFEVQSMEDEVTGLHKVKGVLRKWAVWSLHNGWSLSCGWGLSYGWSLYNGWNLYCLE